LCRGCPPIDGDDSRLYERANRTAMTAGPRVEIQRPCEVATAPRDDEVCRWIRNAITASGTGIGDAVGVVVRIVDEQESRALNCRFRRKDEPTNVLAFPAEEFSLPGLPARRRKQLGDLAICGPVVEREAREQGKDPAAHWAHLLVHGTLHLLGYDHRTETEAAGMERLETSILAARGLSNPYA
jgi:probable rRNA maturation factor